MNGVRRYLAVAAWTAFVAFMLIMIVASPFAMLLLPAAIGGGIMSLFFLWRSRADQRADRHSASERDVYAGVTGSPDPINIGRIRIAGIGGLSFVVVALVIALVLERVGQTVAIGAAGGALIALVVILRRRRAGPLPSSGRTPGANAVLRIEEGGGGDGEPTPASGEDRPAGPALLDTQAMVDRLG